MPAIEIEVCPTCGGTCHYTGLAPESRFPEIAELKIERQVFKCDNCNAEFVKNVSPGASKEGAVTDLCDDDVEDF